VPGNGPAYQMQSGTDTTLTASQKVEFRQTAPSETRMDTEFGKVDFGQNGLLATSSTLKQGDFTMFTGQMQ